MSLAYVERFNYAKERLGMYGRSALSSGIATFLEFAGAADYGPVADLSELVASMRRQEMFFVLNTREPFSIGDKGRGPIFTCDRT